MVDEAVIVGRGPTGDGANSAKTDVRVNTERWDVEVDQIGYLVTLSNAMEKNLVGMQARMGIQAIFVRTAFNLDFHVPLAI